MRKYLSRILVVGMLVIFFGAFAKNYNLYYNIEDGVVSQPIKEIAEVAGVKIENEKDLGAITDTLQKAWFSGGSKQGMSFLGKYHFLTISNNRCQKIKDICLTKLGWKNDVYPSQNLEKYKGVLVCGAFLITMETRIAFYKKLIQKHPELAKLPVYLMTGVRSLEHSEKKALKKMGYDSITDEGGMAKAVWKKYYKDRPYIYVYGSKDGKRATTMSVTKAWMDHHKPGAGAYLMISSGPFIPYQELIMQNFLDFSKKENAHIQIEGIGPGFKGEEKRFFALKKQVGIALDCISRIFYELNRKHSIKA